MKRVLMLLMILAAGCLGTAGTGKTENNNTGETASLQDPFIRFDEMAQQEYYCHKGMGQAGNSSDYPLCPSWEMREHAGSMSIEGMVVEPANESADVQPIVIETGGRPEIIAAFADMVNEERWTNAIRAIGPEGNLLWSFETGEAQVTTLVADDINNDGIDEIIAGTDNGTIYALNADGDLLWEYKAKGKITNLITADISDDTLPEIVFSTGDGMAYALDADGNRMLEYASNVSAMAAADLDRDGKKESIIGQTDGKIVALGAGKKSLWEYPLNAMAIAAGDINNDGTDEIIAGTGDGTIHAINAEGKRMWAYQTGGAVRARPVIADMDKDGRAEVIASSDRIYFLDSKGELAGFTAYGTKGRSKGIYETGERIDATPVASDLDLDGMPELVAITSKGDEIVLSASRGFLANNAGEINFNGKNSPAPNFKIEKNTPYGAGPAVARLDKDPYPDRAYIIPDRTTDKKGRQVGAALYLFLAPSVRPVNYPAVNIYSGKGINNTKDTGYTAEYAEGKVKIRIENGEEAYLMQYDGILSELEKERMKICQGNESIMFFPYKTKEGGYQPLQSGTCALDEKQNGTKAHEQRKGHEIIFMKEKIGKEAKREIEIPVKSKPVAVRLLVVRDTLSQECDENCEKTEDEWYSLGNAKYVNLEVS